MLAALTSPEDVAGLVVVDVAPVNYGSWDVFQGYLKIMQEVDAMKFTSRNDVERLMKKHLPVTWIFFFFCLLLQNDDLADVFNRRQGSVSSCKQTS